LEVNGFRRTDSSSDWNVFFDVSGTHLKTL
jgi:hypothetical protein